MKEKLFQYIEKNEKIRKTEIVILILLLLGSALSFISGSAKVSADPGNISYVGTLVMNRDEEREDYDEDSTVCDVVYVNEDKQLIISYPYEDYLELGEDAIEAYEYECENGAHLLFDHPDPFESEVKQAYRQTAAAKAMPIFNLGFSLLILALSLLIVLLWSQFFTTYEKVWFMSIMVMATIFSVIFPEESANGVNGVIIMALYMLDTFLNILCELLISKQSRYNFLVSVLVEITEIVICIVLMYRFATMVTTLFFWLPIDILSFINWSKHKDEVEDELTMVRRLKGYQEVLFIFFRIREQWIAWYVCALLEAAINILTGQYVLLVLKLGYITNTTYGYIKWSRYINSHKEEKASLF